jgi:CRP/FNR family cyclic AMP-dependent transcriptional regulator
MALWAKEDFSEHEMQRIMHKLLEQVEVFSGLTPQELGDLLENAEKYVFAPGDTILAEGSEGNYLYVLLSGRVKVTIAGPNGGKAEVAKLGPSDCFGEMSLTDHTGRSANVTTLGSCTLIRITERDCWKHPIVSAKLFRNIARILSHRLRAMNAMALWSTQA